MHFVMKMPRFKGLLRVQLRVHSALASAEARIYAGKPAAFLRMHAHALNLRSPYGLVLSFCPSLGATFLVCLVVKCIKNAVRR